jgi:hypothetical protein
VVSVLLQSEAIYNIVHKIKEQPSIEVNIKPYPNIDAQPYPDPDIRIFLFIRK